MPYGYYDYFLKDKTDGGFGLSLTEFNIVCGINFLVGPIGWLLTIRYLGTFSDFNNLYLTLCVHLFSFIIFLGGLEVSVVIVLSFNLVTPMTRSTLT